MGRAAVGLVLAYAEKGGAEDNWPVPLIALLVVASVLVVAGVLYTVVTGRAGQPRQET